MMASAVVKASSPNAPSAVYLDTFNKSADCATDKADIESACRGKSEEKKKNERTRQSGLRRHITQVMSKMDQVGQKIYRYDKGKPPSNSWMDDHCGGMWIKPQFNGMDDYAKEFEEFKQDLNNLGTTIDYYLKNTDKLLRSGLEQLASEAIETLGPDAVDDLVADKLMKDGILAALPIKGKFLVTLGRLAKIGVAGASYMDMAETLVEAVKSEGAKELLDDMKFLVDDAKDRFTEALKTWQKNPDAAMAELMSANAELNKCLRAKKCQLLPFDNNKMGRNNDGRGCCPGQTAHHVIPHAAAKDAGCNRYSYGSAPTICLEGQDNNFGSHGRAHANLGKAMEAYNGKGQAPKPIPYETMRDNALDSIENSTEQCDQACLRAQLDAYYKDCGKLTANPGLSGSPPAKTGDDSAADSTADDF